MARARSADPLQQFRYRVEIDGVNEIGFSRVSGLENELEVAEYREGGYDATRKLPGIQTTGVVTLERGATKDMQMYEWYKEALMDENFRRTVSIIELDHNGDEVRRHVLYEAWASKFTPPELDGSSSEVAIDTVEVQYEDFETE